VKDLFERNFEPFADKHKKTKRQGGSEITFVEWTRYIIRAYETFAEGFSTRVTNIETIGGVFEQDGKVVDDRQVVVVVEVEDMETGAVHQATGAAPVSKTKEVWGGAMAEAESQALRRAFAKFGLGLDMYFDEDELLDMRRTDPTPDQRARLAELSKALKSHGFDEEVGDELGKVADAIDRKKVAGIAVRKLKELAAENNVEWETKDEDPS